MTLQTRVGGDPGGLAACARGMRTLAGALHDGSSGLAAASRVSTDEFDGQSADAFTTTAAALAPKVGDLDTTVRRFGRAVLAYADRLGEVQQVMRRARWVARARGLRVQAGVIHPPMDAATDADGAGGSDDRMRVYRRLQPIVANAWTVLDRAEQDLQDAARLADPPVSLETQWRRGRLTGIPDDVVPAARLPARWPPGEGDWPAEQPPTPSPSGTSTGGAPDEPGHRPVAGHAGARVDAAPATAPAPAPEPAQASATLVGQHLPGLALPDLSALDLAGLGLSELGLPVDWTVQASPEPGVLLVGTAPTSTDGSTPATFEVRTESLTGNVAVWQAQHVTALAGDLPGFSIEDSAGLDVNGRAVSWVQFSHTSGGVEIVHQQWAWEDDGQVVTLSSATPADDFDASNGLFDRLVRSLSFSSMSGGAGGGSAHRGAARS